jgi:hypothetical protein
MGRLFRAALGTMIMVLWNEVRLRLRLRLRLSA